MVNVAENTEKAQSSWPYISLLQRLLTQLSTLGITNYFTEMTVWQWRRLAWGACLSTGLFSFYNLMQFSLFNSISLNLLAEFQLDSMQFSLISGLYLLANALGLFLLGRLLDRYPAKIIGLVFIMIAALGSLMIALSSSVLVLTSMRFLQGLASAASLLLSTRLVVAWFPNHKGIALGVIIAVALSGGIVGNATFSDWAVSLGWRSTLMWSSALGITIFVLMLWLLKDAPRTQAAISEKKQLNRNILFIGSQIGLLNLPIFILGSLWGNDYLQQVYHVTYAQAAEISSYLFLGIMIGGPLSGWISDHWLKRKTLQIGGVISAAGILSILLLAETLTVMQLKCLFLSWGIFSSVQIIGFAQLSELYAINVRSTAIGIAAFMENIVGMLGQWLFGSILYITWDGSWLNNAPLYDRSSYLMSLCLFIAGYLLCIIMWMSRQKSPTVKVRSVELER